MPVMCPSCGESLNEHVTAGKDQSPPRADDYSICVYCYAVLQFNEDLSVRIAVYVPPEVRLERKRFMTWMRAQLN